MFHAVPFLWRFHAIHHSSEKLDWLAAHRVHPVDQVITKSASIVPLFALGFSEAAIAFWGIVYQWQSVYVHANCRIGLGPLGWLVATPHFHHWHHANHKEAWDRNFAGQLPFIDALFGTLYLPAGRMPERYGIDEPVPEHYVQQLLHPILPPSAGTAPTATEPHP
jgi:sterol desaturase/sphingolipid hydroxylase (fatty acid hydroxylase superfamily)